MRRRRQLCSQKLLGTEDSFLKIQARATKRMALEIREVEDPRGLLGQPRSPDLLLEPSPVKSEVGCLALRLA